MDYPWFYQPQPFENNQLLLDEASARHATQVLRMRQGDALCITNGVGALHTCTIEQVSKKTCLVQVTNTQQLNRQVPREVAIGISPLKNASRFEWFLEKATELGVAAILPLVCQRTEREHFRQERLQAICISAMLQSQQTWLPVLHPLQPIKNLLEGSSPHASYHQKWMAHCAPMEKHHLIQSVKPGMHDSLILIGPEGDFSDEEILTAAHAGFSGVSLGPTRLRTETAGVVAATLLCLLP